MSIDFLNSDDHEMKNATFTSNQDDILIPIREAILLLGQTIEWDSKTKTITVTGKVDFKR
ncbi:stalk domain-containing protein [Paenibacillus aquistagni]|uniref:stalk domain-containing protein n=1 Tax=Paenibacillus aquistagni TaxID=1852522 RepID=UPI003F6AB5C6